MSLLLQSLEANEISKNRALATLIMGIYTLTCCVASIITEYLKKWDNSQFGML